MRAEGYRELARGNQLPDKQRIALVTDDRSIEFRNEWCDRVAIIVYAPMDESLVLTAIDRLDSM